MIISKPESEGWLGRYTHNTFENYQLEEYNAAIKVVTKRRIAIDLGGNLGVMAKRLVKDFEFVHAFEPLFHEHLRFNVPEQNIKIYPYAVGDKEATVTMRVGQYHSGGSNVISEIKDKSQVYKEVKVVIVDSFNIEDVDFIKIDVENYEWFALLGSKQTIEKYKPTILMELKKDNTYFYEILKFMQDQKYGYRYVGDEDCLFTYNGNL